MLPIFLDKQESILKGRERKRKDIKDYLEGQDIRAVLRIPVLGNYRIEVVDLCILFKESSSLVHAAPPASYKIINHREHKNNEMSNKINLRCSNLSTSKPTLGYKSRRAMASLFS